MRAGEQGRKGSAQFPEPRALRRVRDGIAHFARIGGQVDELLPPRALIIPHILDILSYDHLAHFAFDRQGIAPERRGSGIKQRQQAAPFQFRRWLQTGDSAACRQQIQAV